MQLRYNPDEFEFSITKAKIVNQHTVIITNPDVHLTSLS
jgi:hypothetical protein